jgi:S-DNA-T family DNA segregation ATPase FtsK/SpoIIIE
VKGRPSDFEVFADDPLSMMLEAALRAAWVIACGVYGFVRSVAHNVLLASVAAALLACTWWIGARSAAAVAAAIVVALAVWRVTGPASFARAAAPRLRLLWRTPLYRAKWQRVALRCGVAARTYGGALHQEPAKDRVPRLLRVRTSATGLDRLLLKLPVGLTPDDVAARAESVGLAFGVSDARVVTARPGRVWLELRRHDPLARVVAPEAPGPVALRGVSIGLGDDAKPWRFRVEGTHALIAGATGAGKGSVLWSLIHGLSPAIREGWVQVWALDPKGGMELGLGRGAFARFEGGVPEAMCDLLEEAVDLKTRRSLDLATRGERLHRPSVASPHLVIIVDELATLSAFAERAVVRRIEHALGLLLTQGRAVGITVIAAVQDPGKDVVSWRDLFPTRVAMRLDNPIQVDMVLGDGARERGARADHISELSPGVAYVRVEGSRDVRRVRSAYLTDADVLALSTSLTDQKGESDAPPEPQEYEGEAA